MFRLDHTGGVIAARHHTYVPIACQTRKQATGQILGEENLRCSGAGPDQQIGKQCPGDGVRRRPRQGHAGQIGEFHRDRLAVKGADLQTSRLQAALVVGERERWSVVGSLGPGLDGAVLVGVSQTVEGRADGRRREVPTRTRRPVAVGVAAAEPADGDGGRHPGCE